MPYNINTVEVWEGTIEDRPGGLADKLEPLAQSGACFEFVLARRAEPGQGLLFLFPIKGARQTKAATEAGLCKAADLAALRIEGPDKPGLGAKISRSLGEAGVNMRGLSAVVVGERCAVFMSLDTKDDAAKARRVLAKTLARA